MKTREKNLQLDSLLNDSNLTVDASKKLSQHNIDAITCDSRQVKPGTLFVAIKGFTVDGHDYIPKAVEAGAEVIVTEDSYSMPTELEEKIIQIKSPDPRQALSLLAKNFWENQPEHCVAVTGTNGKTSVAHFCKQLWSNLGLDAAFLGTLGLITNVEDDITGTLPSLTTLDPVLLHEVLRHLSDRNITHLALEASSHGLDQYRLDGVKVEAAAFTNLSRDHLDYHNDMESYLNAKMRLFEEVMEPNGIAVINADIPEYDQIKSRCEAKGHKIISYGFKGETIKLKDAMPTEHGLLVAFSMNRVDYKIQLPLVGEFQVGNIFAALGLIMHNLSTIDVERSIAFLTSVTSVPGRMEKVELAAPELSIFIDFAHTPDGLEKSLKALQPHVRGKLHVLFGCGGNRDKGKRPQMGKIASQYADSVFITDDNPRHEDAAVIRQEVEAGCSQEALIYNIEGREEAIKEAIQHLEQGDILLVAGKGHESEQIIGDEKIPFNDRQKVEEILRQIKKEK